jgi:cytochrome b561
VVAAGCIVIVVSVTAYLVTKRQRDRAVRAETAEAGQRKVAEATHVLLYLLMVFVPVTGWLMSSAKGFQTVYFGVLPLPDLLARNDELGERLELAHTLLNYGMAALVVAHLGAALKHHFIDRDEVLVRMLPFLGKNPTPGDSR